MADGSAMAASDIAREAKATSARKPAAKAKAPARKRRKFKVDFWATDLNTAELGVLKRTQNEAASDQFTKDMEIIGQTVDGGKREGLIAYRKPLWDEKTDMERRLVVKLFSESLSWRGTMEMMVGRSMQLSRGAGVPVSVFSINLARHDQLIQLERCARQLPLLPERFTFFLQTKTGPRFYTLRRGFLSPRADFSLIDEQGRKIGKVSQRLANLGGAWVVKLDEAYTNRKLETVLELFCAMLKFNRRSKKHIGKTAQRIRDGKITPKLSRQETDLYYNPRRRR